MFELPSTRTGRNVAGFAASVLLATGIGVGGLFAMPSTAHAVENEVRANDEASLRTARARLNEALMKRDTDAMARYWLPGVVTIGGNGSVVIGKKANVQLFKKEIFGSTEFVDGVRTTDKFTISNNGQRAAESGHWLWRMTDGKEVASYRGTYLIYWKKSQDKWMINSEMYITLSL
jgi:ketosteroid isomerase-like protein